MKKNVKALARRRHERDVSALLPEAAALAAKLVAAEMFLAKYGVPPLSAEALEQIEAEWHSEPKIRKKTLNSKKVSKQGHSA